MSGVISSDCYKEFWRYLIDNKKASSVEKGIQRR